MEPVCWARLERELGVTRTRRVEWPADARAIAVAAVAQQADADAAGGSSDEESSDSDDDDAPSDGDLDDGAAFGVSDGAAPTPSPSAANGGRARVRWEQKGAEALRVLGPRYRRLDAQVVAAIVDGAVPADVVVGNITDRHVMPASEARALVGAASAASPGTAPQCGAAPLVSHQWGARFCKPLDTQLIRQLAAWDGSNAQR